MASILDQQIKTNITRLRTKLHLTQADVAERVGLSRQCYRNIEIGRTQLVHTSLDGIARALGSSPEGLILGFDPLDLDSDPRLESFKNTSILKNNVEREYSQREIDRLLAENFQLREKISYMKQAMDAKDQLIDFMKRDKK